MQTRYDIRCAQCEIIVDEISFEDVTSLCHAQLRQYFAQVLVLDIEMLACLRAVFVIGLPCVLERGCLPRCTGDHVGERSIPKRTLSCRETCGANDTAIRCVNGIKPLLSKRWQSGCSAGLTIACADPHHIDFAGLGKWNCSAQGAYPHIHVSAQCGSNAVTTS